MKFGQLGSGKQILFFYYPTKLTLFLESFATVLHIFMKVIFHAIRKKAKSNTILTKNKVFLGDLLYPNACMWDYGLLLSF